MSAPTHRRTRAVQSQRLRNAARGFTMVELMVAMALGLLLLGVLVAMVVSTIGNRNELDKSSRQIENGRYALQVLTSDIESAGFIGTSGQQMWDRRAPQACPTTLAELGYDPTAKQLPLAVQLLTTAPTCLTNVKADTGMLLVTRASSLTTTPSGAVGTEAYLQVSTCGKPSASGVQEPEFGIDTGAGGKFPLRQKDCDTANPAPLRKAIHRIYYIATCNECGADTIPTLKVAEFIGEKMTVTALVDGIENMQFEMGVDMDGNGSPDCYVGDTDNPLPAQIDAGRCPQPATAYDWTQVNANRENVVTVRVGLLARNTESSADWTDSRTYSLGLNAPEVGPFNDRFKRHAYSSVARIINVSALREQP